MSLDYIDDQYGVKLDHRNLRTPLRKLFVVPTKSLAVAVAQEWQAQSTVIQSSLMHLVLYSYLNLM